MPDNNTNIIDSSIPAIVIQETPISLSDEKLKSILLKTYEAAIKNANAPKYYKLYGVLLSVSFTLLVALLTSSFKSLWSIDAKCVTNIAWIMCVICGLLGIAFLIIGSRQKMKNDTEERDKAVNDIFDAHFSGK